MGVSRNSLIIMGEERDVLLKKKIHTSKRVLNVVVAKKRTKRRVAKRKAKERHIDVV